MGKTRFTANRSKTVSIFVVICDEIRILNAKPFNFNCARSVRWQTGDMNDEQKLAVLNILEQRSYPHPYVLFGPPGTGKTKTVVEAVLQLIRMESARKHILVCATSNSACDEIVKRLISNGVGENVFRIFAKSMEEDMAQISAEILAVSNLRKSQHYYPSFAVLSRHKVRARISVFDIDEVRQNSKERGKNLFLFLFISFMQGDRVHTYIGWTIDPRPHQPAVLLAHFRRRGR